MSSEFQPSLRLMVAFYKEPELFSRLRNDMHTVKVGLRPNYYSAAFNALHHRFPILAHEINEMVLHWWGTYEK